MAMVEVPIYAGLIGWVVQRQVREDEDGNGHSHHMGQSYYFRAIGFGYVVMIRRYSEHRNSKA
jgi:hypothetical protein